MFEVSDVRVKSFLLLYFGLQDYTLIIHSFNKTALSSQLHGSPPCSFPGAASLLRLESKWSSSALGVRAAAPAQLQVWPRCHLLCCRGAFPLEALSDGWPLMTLILNQAEVVGVTDLKSLLLLPRNQFCISRGEAVLGHHQKKKKATACLHSCLTKATLVPSGRPLTPLLIEKKLYTTPVTYLDRVWSALRAA